MACVVLLGDVGRTLPEDEQLDLRLSRLGGVPTWPIPPPPNRAASSSSSGRNGGMCGRCGGRRSLVAQVFAAYDGAPGGPCRMLHLFGCLQNACDGEDRAWRVVRTTGHAPLSQDAIPSSSKILIEGCQRGLASSADDWSVNGQGGASEDWGASAELAESNEAEFDELLAARSKRVVVSAIGSSSAAEHTPNSAAQWHGVRTQSNGAVVWPCYSLVIYEEPASTSESGDHEMELLERYRQSEEGADLDRMIQALAVERLGDTSDDCREVPHYFGNGDRDEDADCNWLARFQQRIERSPSQVVRYAWGGKPLWIAKPPLETTNPAWPPPCSQCGSSRVFEFQLLPTLLYQVRKKCPELPVDSEIEWGTVLVYTCGKDCISEEPCDEIVLVQPAV